MQFRLCVEIKQLKAFAFLSDHEFVFNPSNLPFASNIRSLNLAASIKSRSLAARLRDLLFEAKGRLDGLKTNS
jgi:hypothetical protein